MSIPRHCGDPHLGHKNMATLRGFRSVFEHDEYIIKMWNSVVTKRDTTYIHGDVTMETAEYYRLLDRLLGRKIVILGNHDKPEDIPELLKHVDKVCGVLRYKLKKIGKFWLTHLPMAYSEIKDEDINIHAHLHAREFVKSSKYICVSMEKIGYTPRTIEELLTNRK